MKLDSSNTCPSMFHFATVESNDDGSDELVGGFSSLLEVNRIENNDHDSYSIQSIDSRKDISIHFIV
ncbi:hypothetical protein C0J52_14439 [Blattella germanica]|nr:hypothetical protein C0J52_14439 [Blattella germanica]